MDEPAIFRCDPAASPSELDAFVATTFQVERWHLIREGIGAWLVALGVPCWILAAWPRMLAGGSRAAILGLWATLAASFAYALVRELAWARRRQRFLVVPMNTRSSS